MREIYEEEDRKISEIRSAKYSSLDSQMKKVKQVQNSFVKLKLSLRKTVQVSKSWKPHKIPRPVWGEIFQYCELITLSKMERVCKSFFLLLNPLCECSPSRGDPSCRSIWMNCAKRSVKEKYPDANCSYLRRVTVRDQAPGLFSKCIDSIKTLGCSKGFHDWEPSPQNPSFSICMICTRGYKRETLCSGICPIHQKSCSNESRIFKTCPSHSCILCKSPSLLRAFQIITLLKSECENYSIYPSVSLSFKTKLD
jgi:hypothetical protein